MNASNSSAAWVFVFVDSNNKLQPFFNFTFRNYTKRPKIEISEKLTKVVIIGKFIPRTATVGSQAKTRADAYHLDYSEKSYTNISFPMESLPDADTTKVKVGDSFIYTREQESETNETGKTESVYFLSQDAIPVKAYEKNLTKRASNDT